jgi:hypothetical protein
MKKILSVCLMTIIAVACNNADKPAATASSDSTTYPYKASYSSTVSLSTNSKNAQAVLQSYKDWEDNKLSNGTAYFADTVTMIFSDGTTYHLGRDSMLHMFQKDRDSLTSTVIDMQVWTNLRLDDKKEDWVGCWYKQTDTHKNGKIDSAFYQDDNRIKDGKIDLVISKKRAIKK